MFFFSTRWMKTIEDELIVDVESLIQGFRQSRWMIMIFNLSHTRIYSPNVFVWSWIERPYVFSYDYLTDEYDKNRDLEFPENRYSWESGWLKIYEITFEYLLLILFLRKWCDHCLRCPSRKELKEGQVYRRQRLQSHWRTHGISRVNGKRITLRKKNVRGGCHNTHDVVASNSDSFHYHQRRM